jgi:hypothetical protein
MNSHRLRKLHKWLSCLTGLQLLLWLASGCYMVLININFIHGNHLVDMSGYRFEAPTGLSYSFADVQTAHPQARDISLYWDGQAPRYKFIEDGRLQVIDVVKGEPVAALGREQAIARARMVYRGAGEMSDVGLFTTDLPREISPRLAPVWQINFADAAHTSLYVSAVTGELTSQRHDYWRLFDILWMLHIMDYESREDVHNLPLRLLACLGLLTALAGLALLYVSFRRPSKEASC